MQEPKSLVYLWGADGKRVFAPEGKHFIGVWPAWLSFKEAPLFYLDNIEARSLRNHGFGTMCTRGTGLRLTAAAYPERESWVSSFFGRWWYVVTDWEDIELCAAQRGVGVSYPPIKFLDIPTRLYMRVRSRMRAQAVRDGWFSQLPHTRVALEAMLGYDMPTLMTALTSRLGTRGLSWQNFHQWHIDHERPIAAFSVKRIGDGDFKACWALSNLQPLWPQENLSKGARLDWCLLDQAASV